MPDPRRGEIWLGKLDTGVGHEQAGKRPLLIVSDDRFNAGRSGRVIVVPLTSHKRDIPYHIAIASGEGGLKIESFAKCEDVRSIAKERLLARWGAVAGDTLADVEDRLRLLMRL